MPVHTLISAADYELMASLGAHATLGPSNTIKRLAEISGPSRFYKSPKPQTIEDALGCPAGATAKYRFTARLQIRDPYVLVAATDLLVQIDSENSTQPLVLENPDGGPNSGNCFMTVPNKDGYEDGVLRGRNS